LPVPRPQNAQPEQQEPTSNNRRPTTNNQHAAAGGAGGDSAMRMQIPAAAPCWLHKNAGISIISGTRAAMAQHLRPQIRRKMNAERLLCMCLWVRVCEGGECACISAGFTYMRVGRAVHCLLFRERCARVAAYVDTSPVRRGYYTSFPQRNSKQGHIVKESAKSYGM